MGWLLRTTYLLVQRLRQSPQGAMWAVLLHTPEREIGVLTGLGAMVTSGVQEHVPGGSATQQFQRLAVADLLKTVCAALLIARPDNLVSTTGVAALTILGVSFLYGLAASLFVRSVKVNA